MNKTGVDGENFACDYLLRQGYEIIERNYHSRYGEIDIIARDKNRDFVFVEVKSRTKNQILNRVSMWTRGK